MLFADTSGNVQTFDKGTTDNTSTIFYFLETQQLEMGNRAHVNNLSNLISVFTKNGGNSRLQVRTDDDDYEDVKMSLQLRVNTGDGINVSGNYATFKWWGESNDTPPTFEGLYIEQISDEGQVRNQ